MTTLTKQNSEQEIGDLLLKVQDELKGIRSLISKDGSKLDLKILQSTIAKVENEIKEKTDTLINNLNSQVKTLPAIGDQEYSTSLAPLWELTKKEPREVQTRTATLNDASTSSKLALVVVKEPELTNKVRPILEENEQIQEIQISKYGPFGPSPGQQVKIERETRALFNPMNTKNRLALQENYNIQLPLIEKRTTYKMPTHLITGRTVEHLSTLPLVYKRNPSLTPPAINEGEAKYGLLSLIERGLIPSNAKISFYPVPVEAQSIKLAQADKTTTTKLKEISSTLAIESVYKLDPNYNNKNNKQKATSEQRLVASSKETESTDKQKASKKKAESQLKMSSTNKSNANLRANNLNPLPPPVTPSNALQLQLYDTSKFVHRFVIQNGRARTDLPDYITFKQSFCLRWGSIITIIKYLEDLCQTYSIAVGFIDGLKVSELALCIDMDLKPTIDELLDTFLNKDDVEKMVKAPGRKFKRKGGHHLAAIIIQCAWRRYRDRKAYLAYRKRKWAAGVIALTWLTYCKISKAREKLKETRETHLANFRKRQKELIKNWPKIKNSRRVIIHIPSLAFSEAIRDKMYELPIRESYQMGRICDIIDENADVIYVSSIPITEETLQYYFKLLGLRSAIQTGNVNDQKDISHRYKIVIPEALNSFPTHNMALSTLLKYSPKALERIKNLIKGRDAYIIPGVMNHDDLYVADYLNVPLLASEPEISNLYTTKSGSKRIFQSAQVSIPYGEFDIYNKEQLYECFAQAITENLHVQRWLFKLDDESDGRGIGYCDIAKNLACYGWALKEMMKFGDKWSKRWAYEPTYVKILEEIPELLSKHARPANTDVYSAWEEFQMAFLAQGGVLEAHPPSDSITCLTVSVLIEPDQNYKILSSGDHIHAESPYSCWGLSFPQTSVDPAVLNSECQKVINACKQRNIIGYLDIDFVTFIDSKTEKQVIWATDLNISYSDNVSLTSILYYMTNGHFDSTKHSYEIPIEIKTTKKSKNTKEIKEEIRKENVSRFSVMSSKLHHTNLAVIHYSVFFQTCRALGIGYDIQEKQGTVFSLVDSLNHIHLGMLTINDNLQTAMQQFEHNLRSLHNEISSANMQGKTNFLTASADIRAILNECNENPEGENLENNE